MKRRGFLVGLIKAIVAVPVAALAPICRAEDPRWDEPIKSDIFQIGPRNMRIRVSNHVVTVRSHWIDYTKGL